MPVRKCASALSLVSRGFSMALRTRIPAAEQGFPESQEHPRASSGANPPERFTPLDWPPSRHVPRQLWTFGCTAVRFERTGSAIRRFPASFPRRIPSHDSSCQAESIQTAGCPEALRQALRAPRPLLLAAPVARPNLRRPLRSRGSGRRPPSQRDRRRW